MIHHFALYWEGSCREFVPLEITDDNVVADALQKAVWEFLPTYVE
jgi:hypothetical protein